MIRTRWDRVQWWTDPETEAFCEVYVGTREDYDRTLHRLGAYWDMGQSVLTPREVVRSRLDA